MNFLQRLLRYLIGVTIGCVIVYMMFPTYDWLAWLPNRQVRKSILSKSISHSNQATCMEKAYAINPQEIYNLVADGDIDYGKSQAQGRVKNYVFETDKLRATVQVSDSTAAVLDFERVGVAVTLNCP
jgi:hypothetical protein